MSTEPDLSSVETPPASHKEASWAGIWDRYCCSDGWLDFLKVRPREWTTADPAVRSWSQVRTGPTVIQRTLVIREQRTVAWVFETPLRQTVVMADAQGHLHTHTQDVRQTLVVRSDSFGPFQVTHMEVEVEAVPRPDGQPI